MKSKCFRENLNDYLNYLHTGHWKLYSTGNYAQQYQQQGDEREKNQLDIIRRPTQGVEEQFNLTRKRPVGGF